VVLLLPAPDLLTILSNIIHGIGNKWRKCAFDLWDLLECAAAFLFACSFLFAWSFLGVLERLERIQKHHRLCTIHVSHLKSKVCTRKREGSSLLQQSPFTSTATKTERGDERKEIFVAKSMSKICQ
jgi:hypothetical protein